MIKTRTLTTVVVALILTGCSSNLANVRTLASTVQTVTGDTSDIIAADQSTCEENVALQREFNRLSTPGVTLPDCSMLSSALQSILVENKALQAYGNALSNIAADQFATTTGDSQHVTATMQSSGISAPVQAAIASIFATVEQAALNGYRQHELVKVMTGAPATAFKTVMANYKQLTDQYSGALSRQLDNIDLIQQDITRHDQSKEPLAVAEFSVRLSALKLAVQQKASAVKAFSDAVDKVDPAFDDAVQDLHHPNPKEIYQSVQTFATQAKDAHDKLKKAFG